jgi:pimeloyl-ACP methyl ester carboxylesterase
VIGLLNGRIYYHHRKTIMTSFLTNNIKTYLWLWQGQEVHITYELRGHGQSLLLLPAFSTVCSRTEVGELAQRLASKFQTIALDWPGFGDSDRPKLNYAPTLYQQFLQDFVRDCVPQGGILLAAGHSAGYALQVMKDLPRHFDRLILVSPTWRGPLPTMMKGQKPWFATLRGLVRTPILGQGLYRLNTTKGFLRMMYSRHVYADSQKITAELIDRKQQITQQPGARYAPVAFVTGGLDPVVDRASFQALWPLQPLLLIIGADSPPKSLGEMQSMAGLPGVTAITLPGTLGIHEENAAAVATAILQQLDA